MRDRHRVLLVCTHPVEYFAPILLQCAGAQPGMAPSLVREGRHNAVILLTGCHYASFWVALAAAKFHAKSVLFGTDAVDLSFARRARMEVRGEAMVLAGTISAGGHSHCAIALRCCA
jgi:hypothetical protein